MLGQLCAILAVFEFRKGDFASLFKVSVFVKQFVDFVLDLSLKVELFHETGNAFTDFIWLTFSFDDFFFDCFLETSVKFWKRYKFDVFLSPHAIKHYDRFIQAALSSCS